MKYVEEEERRLSDKCSRIAFESVRHSPQLVRLLEECKKDRFKTMAERKS